MRTRHFIASAVLLLVALAARQSARADAFSYATDRHVVRVGQLVSSAVNQGANGPENPDPHVFYVLDARTDLKPSGLELENPMAPPVITNEIYQRWKARVKGTDPAFQTGTSESQIFQVGMRVTKNMGAYWEVNLDDATQSDLSQFDLLYIHSHVPKVSFTPDQKEKLRKFVEGGGTLWIEDCGGLSFDPYDPFILDVQFHGGNNGSSSAVIAAPNHPLMSSPYLLSPAEIQNIGDKHVNDYYLYQQTDRTTMNGPGANVPPGGQTLVPIVWNTRGNNNPGGPYAPNDNWRPYILAGPYGGGRLVFSSGDSGCAINDYVGGVNAGYGGNSGAVSGNVLLGAHPSDLKFAYNMLYWSGAHTTVAADVRRSGGASEPVPAVLRQSWTGSWHQPGPTKLYYKTAGAAYYKHCVYAVDGNLWLHCWDANPDEDLDGDGNPDDGLPTGAPVAQNDPATKDELWAFDLKTLGTGITGASAPVVIDFYDVNGPTSQGLLKIPQRTLVVVALNDGTIVALRALPRTSSTGQFAPFTVVDWQYKSSAVAPYAIDTQPYTFPTTTAASATQDLPLPTLAYSEGVLFATVNTTSGGRLVALDPRSGTSVLHPGAQPGDETAVPKLGVVPPYMSSPAVGYVRDVANGADDKMVYVSQLPQPSATLAATVNSFWFGTRSERLERAQAAQTFNSRATVPWFDPITTPGNTDLRPRVVAKYAPNGVAVRSTELDYLPGGLAALTGQQTSFAIGYANGRAQAFISTQVKFPDGTTVNYDDGAMSYYADYTLDWTQNVSVNRTQLVAPDPQQKGNTINGGASLTPTDLVCYSADLSANGNMSKGVIFATAEQRGRTAVKWAYVMHDGFTVQATAANNGSQPDVPATTVPPRLIQSDAKVAQAIGVAVGAPILNVQFVGAPAYRNGTVYASATGNVGAANGPQVSLLMAFDASPTVQIRLPQPIDPTVSVSIFQYNPAIPDASGNPTRVDLQASQFTVDRDNGIITITSMAPVPMPQSNLTFVSNSLPFFLKLGQNSAIALTPLPGEADNLRWYAVIPTAFASTNQFTSAVIDNPLPARVCSSPGVQGETVWLGTIFASILSLDADPGATDPSAQTPGAQVSTDSHLRWVHQLDGPESGTNHISSVWSPPVAASGLLMAHSTMFTNGFGINDNTVIADNNRLLEVNPAGEAVWTCDATKTYEVAGGDLPLYLTDPNTGNVTPANQASATGVPISHKVPLQHPSKVGRIGRSDYLVVDTGNNRVIQMDHGGNVVWEVTSFSDDYKHLLRPGDPLSLNGPTDCDYWTQFSPSTSITVTQGGNTYTYSGPAYVIHYMIADPGNYRVVEVVDVYDAGGRPVTPSDGQGNPGPITMLRQLNFVTQTYAQQGRRYRYQTASRLMSYDPTSKQTSVFLVSAVSNYRVAGPAAPAGTPTGDATDSGGGALVVTDALGNQVGVINDLGFPTNGNYRVQPIVNPTFASRYDTFSTGQNGSTTVVEHLLICDANGCYDTVVDPTHVGFAGVTWALTAKDYFLMTGKQLAAVSMQKVTGFGSGAAATGDQYLITNRFTGFDDVLHAFGVPGAQPQPFGGEVFVVRASQPGGFQPSYAWNGGLASLVANPNATIVWRVPTEQPDGQLLVRHIGTPDRGNATGLLQQPSSAAY